MSKKTVGYIVIDERNIPLQLCKTDGYLNAPEGIEKSLVIGGNKATVFPDRRSAAKALKDTARIEAANSYPWCTGEWRIVRLMEE
jgi:hypothetical protein